MTRRVAAMFCVLLALGVAVLLVATLPRSFTFWETKYPKSGWDEHGMRLETWISAGDGTLSFARDYTVDTSLPGSGAASALLSRNINVNLGIIRVFAGPQSFGRSGRGGESFVRHVEKISIDLWFLLFVLGAYPAWLLARYGRKRWPGHWIWRPLGSVAAGAAALVLEVFAIGAWATGSMDDGNACVCVILVSIPASLVTALIFWRLEPCISRVSVVTILAALAGAAVFAVQMDILYFLMGRDEGMPKYVTAIFFGVYCLPGVAAGSVFRVLAQPAPDGRFCSCSYDLTGNTSGVCPECGERIVSPSNSVPSASSCSEQEPTEATERFGERGAGGRAP